MHLLNRRTFLQMTAASGAALAAGGMATPARAAIGAADVFTADEFGGLVDSALVVGEDNLLLIDAQFTVPDWTELK